MALSFARATRARHRRRCWLVVTNRESFVLGCRSMPGNPYDGHTLAETPEQAAILSGIAAKRRHVDRGYKGSRCPGCAYSTSGSAAA